MIIWLDRDGRYIYANKAATDLLGYPAEELLELSVWDVDPFFPPEKWQAHWDTLRLEKSCKLETFNQTRSGRLIPVEFSASFVTCDGREFSCSIVRDMTVYKRTEQALRSLNETIFRLSITDSLTGIANRRYFDEVLLREIERHDRLLTPLSVIFLDIDYFKEYNDCYGHVAGDECLQQVGLILRDTLSLPGALAARYGGEEFACILPDTPFAVADALAGTIRTRIISRNIAHKASAAAGCVTCSLGVLTVTEPGMTSREILSAVDSLLYRAKREGRNRVTGECR